MVLDEITLIGSRSALFIPSLWYMQWTSSSIASHLNLISSCVHLSACVATSLQLAFGTRVSNSFSQLPMSLLKFFLKYMAKFTTRRKSAFSSMKRWCTILYQSLPPKSITDTLRFFSCVAGSQIILSSTIVLSSSWTQDDFLLTSVLAKLVFPAPLHPRRTTFWCTAFARWISER